MFRCVLSVCLATLLCNSASLLPAADGPQVGRQPIAIASRRELFVDKALIARLSSGARRVLHHPVPRNVAITFDKPWEGSGCGYPSVFKDGNRYRMYYHGLQYTIRDGKFLQPHKPVWCYAESSDGIHWKKPDLGLFTFGGSKQNNIVGDMDTFADVGADPAHVAVFKDANPDCPPDTRYKAIVRCRTTKGLLPFGSPDGIHWSPLAKKPVITRGAFDSENLAFWDPVRHEYRCYFRIFTNGRRDIATTTSKDFLHWAVPLPLQYPGARKEQLYTNQIKPYYRAPQILIGFPTRYIDRGWSASMKALPDAKHRRLRSTAVQRYGTAITDGLLMSSRDGRVFHRWAEAFLRPGPERTGSWAYGDHYIAWQLVETPSNLEDAPNELSIYAIEDYWTGTRSRMRRYTLRIDGFVSVAAPMSGGELLTKLLTFKGKHLGINFSTSVAGSIRVEIQDAAGKPISGFLLADCPDIFGDTINRTVTWKSGSDVSRLADQPVRLRFVLKDADLYALQFR